jgi:hypothetical protein
MDISPGKDFGVLRGHTFERDTLLRGCGLLNGALKWLFEHFIVLMLLCHGQLEITFVKGFLLAV